MTIYINKKKSDSKIVVKKCSHFGCDAFFTGTNRHKFCEKHNNRIDRNIRRKNKNGICGYNLNIKFNNIFLEKKILCCGHWSCNKHFEIIAQVGVNVYPKYCEEHRSEYKRGCFEKL